MLSAVTAFALVTAVGVIGDRISRAHDAVKASTPAPVTASPDASAPSTLSLAEPRSPVLSPTPSLSPSSGPGEIRALLSALRRIDPALDDRRAIGLALESCRDLASGTGRPQVAERTRLRFDRFGGAAGIGVWQADLILTAIERFCPS
ncbi:hypothetical protein GCM10017600_22800 [Streptosporangium carneum]|uniref:DUF732 domain-containing protein n=1 Tax=Streptosporangium carneum TaxID=47481 RepID=A0A9W6MCH8_9ACTN|nr:hypothetical protein GCM10017600_22800 [Streptosporangium carneum]